MSFLTMEITCVMQEDYTGSDDLSFELNGQTIGSLTIATGETKYIQGASPILYPSAGQGIMVTPGDNLKIWEKDLLDPNDLLLDYTVSQTDIDAGTVDIPFDQDTTSYIFKFIYTL